MEIYFSPNTIKYLQQLSVLGKARRQTMYMMLRYKVSYR